MSSSAFVGQQPASNDDQLIIRGYARTLGIRDDMMEFSQASPPFVNRQPSSTSYGLSNIASMAVAIALVVLITGTRLCLRVFRKNLSVGCDDCVIIPAVIGAVAWFGMMIVMAVVGGAGKHVKDVTYSELNDFYRFARLSELVFWITAGLTAISITLFNSRLTSLTSGRWAVAHNTFLVLLIGFIAISLLASLFQCTPIMVQYSLIDFGSLSKPPQCIDSNTLSSTLSIVHSIFNLALLCLSTIFIYQIKMSTGTKTRLSSIFLIGLISCTGSIMRLVVPHQDYPDIIWAYKRQMAWSAVDLFFAITAASLPVLNALLPKSWRGWMRSTPRLAGLSIFNAANEKKSNTTAFANEKAFQGPENTANAIMLVAELDKDSFTRRTERRWDEAFEKLSHSVTTHQIRMEKV